MSTGESVLSIVDAVDSRQGELWSVKQQKERSKTMLFLSWLASLFAPYVTLSLLLQQKQFRDATKWILCWTMQGREQNGVLTWVVGNDDSHVSTAIVLDERLKVLMRSGCAVQRENGDRFRRVALLQSVRVVYLQCQSFGHLCVHSLLGRPLLVQLSAGGDHY